MEEGENNESEPDNAVEEEINQQKDNDTRKLQMEKQDSLDMPPPDPIKPLTII